MRDRQDEAPFDWLRRGNAVVVTYRGRLTTVLRKDAASRFLDRVQNLDEDGAQQLMVRVTGTFKRGNERR